MYSHNTSGITGVCFDEQSQKWCAQIHTNGKQIHLGSFHSFEDAVKAREAAEIKYGYTVRKEG